MKPCPAPSTAVPVAMAAISARSWPEVKALPAAREHHGADRLVGVGGAAGRPSASWYMAVSKALRTSGRLKAMTRTPGAASSVSTRLTGSVLLGRVRRAAAAARRRRIVSAAPLMPVEMGQPT